MRSYVLNLGVRATAVPLGIVLVGLRLAAAEALSNPGFESGTATETAGWSVPTYWQGALGVAQAPGEAHSGKRAVRLSATEKGGQWWGRVLGTPLLDVHLGRPFRFSVWAKGSGSLRLGVIRYRPQKPGENPYVYLWHEDLAPLTPEWREIALEYTIWEPEFQRTAFCIEVQGENAVALLDDVAVTSRVADGVGFTVEPLHPMLAAGHSVPLHFRLTGTPAAGTVQVFAFPPSGDPLRQDVVLGGEGVATYALAPGSALTGLWRLVAAHAPSGATAEAWADVLPAVEFDRFEQAAGGLKLPEGRLHLLVIGDSLTDFNRGSNYVDKLAFWLSRRGGSRCTVRNVGVGGDDITRVWARLNRVPGTYRQTMYEGIFEPRPTHILVFLGHNDSKAKSSTGYTEHAVAPEVFEDTYRNVLAKLGADTGAALVVMSATSSVYEITKATAEKSQAAGKGHNLFGKPEHLERFNAIAQKVAADAGATYLDVYAPTRDYPDKARLFTADGVHLSAEGHRIVALFLLERLFR